MDKIDHILSILEGHYYDYQPNDPNFLEEFEELADRMRALERMPQDTKEDKLTAIQNFADFLEEWFPDSIDEEDQQEVRNAIDAAYNLLGME